MSFLKIITIYCSVRARLKHVLRQYELREKHFECVIRSKDLEILLSKARAAEQKQIADGERTVVRELNEEVGEHLFHRSLSDSIKFDIQNGQLKKEVVQAQAGHSKLIEKLAASCKDVSSGSSTILHAAYISTAQFRTYATLVCFPAG